MADETIRFFEVPPDTGVLAMAEVTLFPGVALRGWQVAQRGTEIEVRPPHHLYDNPETGAEAVFDLLHFENEKTRTLWLSRLKEAFAKWQKGRPAKPQSSDTVPEKPEASNSVPDLA